MEWCYGLALIEQTRVRSRRRVIKLLAKLRIVMLRRREKERKRREEKKRFDALSHKQEVLPTVKYDPGVAHGEV